MTSIDDIEFGLEINELENKLLRKNIALIGLASNIYGYSPKAYNYLDHIVHSIKFKPRNFTVFDAHFKNIAREMHISDLIDSNISLRYVKMINHEEMEEKIKQTRKNLHLPNDDKLNPIIRVCYGIKEREIFKDDKDILLRDSIINNEETHIFYSTDILDIPKEYRNLEFEVRKRNFEKILSLNPSAQIYSIGVFTPNGKDKNDDINEVYKKIASEFGTIYINPLGLEKYLKKEKDNDTYYLSENGTILLSLKCIEAMHNYKISGNDNDEFQPIILPNDSLETNALNYLYERSVRRCELLENYLEDIEDKDVFFKKTVENELEQQKIYQKIKKGTYLE